MLPKSKLLARLAEGHAARLTVVTPNTRLARALQQEFDSVQIGLRKNAWEAPDILPFDAFVGRLYEDALYSDAAGELPLLLAPAQEEWVWQEVVAASRSELLSVRETAAQCRDAWRLVHEWRIGAGHGNEDAQAFHAWSSSYVQKTRGEIDAARLPDLLSGLKGLKLPKTLVAYGFDIVKPQAKAFMDACRAAGVEVEECRPEAQKGSVSRAAFLSAADELEKAASWARARLESGATRIGVVVPDLQQRRREVARVFARVLGNPQAFNVSIGIPLVQYPVAALALSLIRFSRETLSFPEVSNLILSPFIAGAESEMAARAKADAALRRKLDATVSLPKLIGLLEKSILRERMERVFNLAKDDLLRPQTPSEWARHFTALLEAAGFPGERGLDSAEFQANAKLNEMLGELSRLERISPRISFDQALSFLGRLCGELFQPESPGAPIQVLGVLESAGLSFDCLWVSGLSDEAWPLKARPNPFVPVALQKKAGIPEASAETSLALDRRITEGWAAAGQEVVFSYFSKDKDRELAPSPLILGYEASSVEIPAYARHRDRIFALKKIQKLDDVKAPAFASKQVRGGTRVLADQSACPFRAFAHWRLGARELEAPAEGLDARERGTLLHALMRNLWLSLKDSSSLEKDTGPAIEAAAAAAVKELALEGRFAELERARLARLAREWLEVEKRRPPFEVASLEEKRTFSIQNLEFSGRIDRMDRLAGGGHALFDYKTSRAPTPKHWEPPRPEDPQIPLYAVTAKEEISAVAFAKLRPGDMKLMGFSKKEGALPGVKTAKAWGPLLESWKQEARNLATGFAAGEARVDPKRGLQTCRYCDLHSLCRVYEKINPLKEDYDEEGTGA